MPRTLQAPAHQGAEGELQWTETRLSRKSQEGSLLQANVFLFPSSGELRMGWPCPPATIRSLGQKRPLPEECGVPTPTSEGRRGLLRGSHRQGREGPKTPTATPAVPCSKRDYCNPLCRGETAAKFIVTGLLPELRGQGLPRACITLGLQLVHSQLGAVCLCSGGGVAGQRMAT